jgi:IMP dehydrogenase
VELALAFDDVQIVPTYSSVPSRKCITLSSKITKNWTINAPFIASPMDTVCGPEMALFMLSYGGLGIIHRFQSIAEQVDAVQSVVANVPAEYCSAPVAAAIGATGDYLERAEALSDAGVGILLIDVAHGHSMWVKAALPKLNELLRSRVDVIAGSIATYAAAVDLASWGAAGLRVGLGNGSLCETRVRTGCGVPQVTALQSVKAANTGLPIIADGGIRTPGDAAKAIAAGGDTVMLGSLLAGTAESPGLVSMLGQFPNEKLYKKYRGSASLDAKSSRGDAGHIEGNSALIPYKGKASRVLNAMTDGLSSACSYVGAFTIADFRENAQLVRVTHAGNLEGHPHLLA